jgi:hypothetical protein
MGIVLGHVRESTVLLVFMVLSGLRLFGDVHVGLEVYDQSCSL